MESRPPAGAEVDDRRPGMSGGGSRTEGSACSALAGRPTLLVLKLRSRKILGASMKSHYLVIATTMLPLIGFGLTAPSASAQEAKDIVGSWAHVSNINTAADGTKSD